MHSRSLARELALLVLGQTSESAAALAEQPAMDGLLQKALDSLMLLWRETLDGSAADLERAQQSLLDSELNQDGSVPTATVTSHLRSSISAAEQVLNGLSACLTFLACCFWRIRNRSARTLFQSSLGHGAASSD